VPLNVRDSRIQRLVPLSPLFKTTMCECAPDLGFIQLSESDPKDCWSLQESWAVPTGLVNGVPLLSLGHFIPDVLFALCSFCLESGQLVTHQSRKLNLHLEKWLCLNKGSKNRQLHGVSHHQYWFIQRCMGSCLDRGCPVGCLKNSNASRSFQGKLTWCCCREEMLKLRWREDRERYHV
jgi:hypothetical protein